MKYALVLAIFVSILAISCQRTGSDRDEHGCIPSAGYTWCEAKQKCLRTWEEPCQTEEIKACVSDADCVPMPGCHPTECINKKYTGNYKQPDACTAIYMSEAAYSPEDCACSAGLCKNKNLGRKDDTPVYGFEQCVADGNPVMESYPRKCTAKGITYEEDIIGKRHVCTVEESQNAICTMEYAPVCGEIVLNMGRTIYQTFSNACMACASMKAIAYTPGECAEESSDICYNDAGDSMTLNEAIEIAKGSECGDNFVCSCPDGFRLEGDSCAPECHPGCPQPFMDCSPQGYCNSITGTYWLDLTIKKEGCNPACVVDVATRTAEINWRCTGGIPG